MIRDDCIWCDVCLTDDVTRNNPWMGSVHLWPFEGWLEEDWHDGPVVHICPYHAVPERREHLADGFTAVCERCRRTSRDDPPAPAPWRSGLDEDGRRVTVCADCFDHKRDATLM